MLSRLAAIVIKYCLEKFSATTISIILGCPRVNVPVLSKAIALSVAGISYKFTIFYQNTISSSFC